MKEIEDVTLEVDADSLVYRIGYAVDTIEEGEQYCEYLIRTTMQQMEEDTQCTDMKLYLGTHTNYRTDLSKINIYKGNRSSKTRPAFYDIIRTYLIKEYGAEFVYGEEAEDRVGIQAYSYDDPNAVIVGAIDKDMDMISGYRYNYAKRNLYYINKYEALRSFYKQLLTGDTTDNIPGLYHQLLHDNESEAAAVLKGSRYKKKIIEELETCTTEADMYKAVYKYYEDYGQIKKHGITRILEVGRLLWIRRTEDELWAPPTERDFDYLDLDNREESICGEQ